MNRKPARLSDILNGMEAPSEEIHCYFDRHTGKVECVTDEDISAAEDGEPLASAPDWQRDCIEIARAIEADDEDRFVPLPDEDDLDKWDMMKRFAQREAAPEITDTLLDAIHGRGAFRLFKSRIHELNLTEQWYAYRDKQYQQIAIDWCEENGIEWVQEDRSDTPGDVADE